MADIGLLTTRSMTKLLLTSCFIATMLGNPAEAARRVSAVGDKKCEVRNSQLKCYKCDSASDYRCGSGGRNFSIPAYEHTLCPDGIVHCHTLKVVSNETVVYKRGCAAYNPVKQGCRKIVTDDGLIKECFCNKHICNGASGLQYWRALLVTLVATGSLLLHVHTHFWRKYELRGL